MKDTGVLPTAVDDATTARTYAAWRAREDTYAEALAGLLGTGLEARDLRESAMDLARLRALADRARDRFFRRVLD